MTLRSRTFARTHRNHASVISATLALTGTLLAVGPAAAGTEAGATEQQQGTAGMTGGDTQQSAGMTEGQMQQGAQQGDKGLVKRLPERYKLSTWMGKQVENPGGETLGTVKDLVMDDLGQVRYVVMSSELFADERKGDLVAVPAGHFKYPLAREDSLVLDVTPQHVQGAPTFGATDWPDMGHEEISTVIVTYWVPEEGAQQGQAMAAEDHDSGQDAAAGAQAEGQRQAGTGGGMQAEQGMTRLSKEQRQAFQRLDANNNGVIERDEAKTHDRLSQQFDRVDTYGNKAITRGEFAAFEIKEEAETGEQQGQDQQGM